MNQSNNNRRSGRGPETPERVSNAAEKMRSTSAHGNYRGYVPQKTGVQPAIGQGVPMPPNGQPMGYGMPLQTGMQQTAYYAVPQGNGNNRGFGTSGSPGRPAKKRRTWVTVLIVTFITGIIALGIYTLVSKILNDFKDQEIKQMMSEKVTPYDGLFCPGVYVDGIDLSGMTPEQAMNSVQSQINQRRSAWSVQLLYQGNVMATVNSDLLNMNIDQNELNSLMNEAWKQGHTGTIEERFDQMEALEKTPYSVYTAKPSGDSSQIDNLLASLKQQIDTPAQDAQVLAFDTTRANPFVYSEEKTGLCLDIEPLKEQLYQMVSTMTSGNVELNPVVIHPQQTVAELEKHYALRAMATTPIDKHSTEDRNNNIRRCFQLISGTVVQPGKTFSFNKTVGPRTIENGFYPAIEYINDEHVEGIGGGACQASTTVYQAAVCAGMEITSRRPHSDSVSYAEYGMDATVYMGGKQIDLTFRNNTDEPIYITAEVLTDPKNTKRLMTKVCIYGADLGNIRYTLETETVETLPSIMEPVYVNEKEKEEKARDGCVVNSYRMTYTDGILTNREFLFKDTYNPKPEKIYDPGMAQ